MYYIKSVKNRKQTDYDDDLELVKRLPRAHSAVYTSGLNFRQKIRMIGTMVVYDVDLDIVLSMTSCVYRN